MRIINVGREEACVILKTRDLEQLTGLSFLDYKPSYPTGTQFTHQEGSGMVFDLTGVLKSLNELCCVFEQQSTVLNQLKSAHDKVERMVWPARKLEVIQAKLIEKKEAKNGTR